MKRLLAVGGVTLVLGLGGWFGFNAIKLYLPGIIGNLQNPIQPNQPVNWQPGPTVASAPESRPPNIILILADDLGYNDITLVGGVANGAVPTPNIDSLARDGARFANGYAANATCAPSRAAMMTGRYATRFGYEFTPVPVRFARNIAQMGHDADHPPIFHEERVKDVPPVAVQGMPPSEITIAEALRPKGYHSIHLGKWHLGEAPNLRPEAQGFDESLGFWAGAAMFMNPNDPDVVNSKQDFDPIDRFLWANLPFSVRYNSSKPFKPSRYMTDYLGDEAVKAIAANRNRPFFMYLAFNAPHTPLQATKADYDALSGIKDHRLRVYGGMVRALDRNVGKVLDALKAQGLADNTLVIFTSDNGGANYIGLPDINRPYRGFKATFFEGGLHVPFLMRWPSKVVKGMTVEVPAMHVDIYSTALAAAGATPATDRPIDGLDLMQIAAGKTAPRALFFQSGPYRAVISGGWKLQRAEGEKKIWLFDLSTDPTERQNKASTEPARVAALTALLNEHAKQQSKPQWPALIEGAIPIDRPLGMPGRPGEEFVLWSN